MRNTQVTPASIPAGTGQAALTATPGYPATASSGAPLATDSTRPTTSAVAALSTEATAEASTAAAIPQAAIAEAHSEPRAERASTEVAVAEVFPEAAEEAGNPHPRHLQSQQNRQRPPTEQHTLVPLIP